MDNWSFTKEQIIDSYHNYDQVASVFMELAPDATTKEKLKSVLYDGKINEKQFVSGLSNKDNPYIEGQRRIGMAYLFVNNPETFNYFMDNDIKLFHGTNASALPSILKYGLNSIDKSKELGIETKTGEEWSRINGKRSFASLTDVLDLAENYSQLRPQVKEDNMDFPVIIGTSVEEVKKHSIVTIHSDTPEVGIKDGLNTESILVLGVPSERVEIVKKLSGDSIQALPIDNIKEKFYYIDDFGPVLINYDKVEKLKEHKEDNKKSFSFKEFRDLCLSRTIDGIKKAINNMGLMTEERVEEDGRKH